MGANEDISSLSNISIKALSKTYLSKKVFHGEIDIDGSVYHRSDRVNRTNGSVIIYTKNNLSSTKVLEFGTQM